MFSIAAPWRSAKAGAEANANAADAYEIVSLAVTAELNPQGRAMLRRFNPDLKPEDFAGAAL